MITNISFASINVTDLDRAKAFYADTVGFEVTYDSTAIPGQSIGRNDLVLCNPVLGFQRGADNPVAVPLCTGIVAKTDGLGHVRDLADKTDIIKVEDATAIGSSQGKFICRRIIRGKHQLIP